MPETYDAETDEVYFSTFKEEEMYMASFEGMMKCTTGGERVPRECGIVVEDGFVCNHCKAGALQQGLIALCLNCGDYFWLKPQNPNAIKCGACDKSGGAG